MVSDGGTDTPVKGGKYSLFRHTRCAVFCGRGSGVGGRTDAARCIAITGADTHAGRASSMPENENLRNFAKTGATLALHLSIQNLETTVAELMPFYGADCPVVVVYRASWPDQQLIRGSLGNICTKIVPEITRTALILVGPVLDNSDFDDSCLYAQDYDRRYRPQDAQSTWAHWQEGDD